MRTNGGNKGSNQGRKQGGRRVRKHGWVRGSKGASGWVLGRVDRGYGVGRKLGGEKERERNGKSKNRARMVRPG